MAVSRILVPVDFSPCSRAALEHAVPLAAQLKAELDVLYVHEPSGYVGTDALAMMPEAARGQAFVQTRADVLRELDGFLGSLRTHVRSVRVEPGLAADVIPAVARDGEFDLIVMGTHGRSGLSRLLVGSVAEAVMRRAQVPVMTLRLPKKETRERIPL